MVKRRRRRRRLLIAAPFLAILAWAAVSYISYITLATSMTWSERSAEWVRADVPLGNWLVDESEHVYYSLNAPGKGGVQLKALPHLEAVSKVPPARRPAAVRRQVPWPPPIRPIFAHPLPGEGVWEPISPRVDGGPTVLLARFRSELAYPRIVAYLAWFDHARTAIAYYPGRYEPPHAAVRGPMMVPHDQRYRLLATFNG
ncbi:MAG: hypothetical protein ACRDNS_11100, partial [Trebonia sp.]